MRIVKIILEDGTEEEFYQSPLASGFSRIDFKDWEQEKIFPNLMTDLEEYSKWEFGLISKPEPLNIESFNDREIVIECRKRGLSISEMKKESIINQDFIRRIVEISHRGDDVEIDNVLENLEKKYKIK